MNKFKYIKHVFSFAAAAFLLLLPLCLRGGWVHPSVIKRPVVAVVLLLLGVAFTTVPGLNRISGFAGKLLFESRRLFFNIFLFLVGFLLYSWASHHLFAWMPTLDDGVGALFQARLFAIGRIVIPLPQNDHFLRVFGVLNSNYNTPHWTGMYPPGWPALLTPGVLIGASWAVTPAFGGGLAVMTSEFAGELFGKRTGRLAGLFSLTSPFVLVLAATHLSHVATAFLCCLCAWSVLKMAKTSRSGWAVLAGVAWAIAFLCRPLTALVMGAVTAILPLCEWRRSLKAWRGIVVALLLAIFAGGTLALFQHITTGDSRKPGHTIGLGTRGKFGFVYLDHARTHTPQLGFEHTMKRMQQLNMHALGWPLPMYLFAFLPFLMFRSKWTDWWLFMHQFGLLLAYSAFWYYESCFPARYSFASIPMVMTLCSRGVLCLYDAAGEKKVGRRVVAGVIVGFILFSVTTGGRHYMREYDPNFGDVESVLPRVVKTYGITNAVVFMDAQQHALIRDVSLNDFYATGFMLNDLTMTNDVIYVRNLREENPLMMRQYPDRNYYLYRYQRAARKARLFRMYPTDDGSFSVHPVPPIENELLMPLAAGDEK